MHIHEVRAVDSETFLSCVFCHSSFAGWCSLDYTDGLKKKKAKISTPEYQYTISTVEDWNPSIVLM